MYFRKLETGIGLREPLDAYLKCLSVYAHVYPRTRSHKTLHCETEWDLFAPL